MAPYALHLDDCVLEKAKMPSVVSLRDKEPYLVVSPEGGQIEVPKELYVALRDFIEGSKCNGSIVIQFRNGGIAGLEALVKKTYK
jgi:hypothetical protein